MTFLQDVHPWVTKLPLGANVKHYDILIAPLKTKYTTIWYLRTTKKASVPKIPKIGTLVPQMGRTRYQIDSFWYLEIPIFGI